jgi:hypothetical protein
VFNLGDVDAAGLPSTPNTIRTRNPDAKINGEEGVDSDPDSINTRRIVLVEETERRPCGEKGIREFQSHNWVQRFMKT